MRRAVTLTPTGVDLADSVPSVSSRSLSPTEIANIRDRVLDLVKELGSQTAVAEYTGIKQQSISKIISGDRGVGYNAASRIAAADRVPPAALLAGIPRELYTVIGEKRRSPSLVALMIELSNELPRLDEHGWRVKFRQAEDAIEKLRLASPNTKLLPP